MPPLAHPAKRLKVNAPDKMVNWNTRIPQWLYDKLGNVAKASGLDGRNHVVIQMAIDQFGESEHY